MLETIKLILTILPLIINLTKELETAFPESGLGKMKASLILESIKSVIGDSDSALRVVKQITDTVVSVFNTFGVFKK
jgi:hypothetical protein